MAIYQAEFVIELRNAEGAVSIDNYALVDPAQ
jgi:hypothetical protein